MKFTNKLNYPQYIVDWLSNDSYDYDVTPLTISATTLMKPTQAYILSSRYSDQLEIDISELISSRFGNAVHDSIERIQTEGVSKEQRIKKTIEVDGTVWTVTGKYDLLVHENGVYTIRDIKTTSVWAYIYGGKDEDYKTQLSTYRWLLTPEYNVNPIAYIDFFFTDWQSSKAKTEDKYPPGRLHPGHKIDLLPIDEMEAIIKNKLRELMKYEKTADKDLPECTKKELWAEDDSYAVFKIGNKRATKVCDSKEEAEEYQKNNKISGYIQHRPGKVKRCKYCSAAPFCKQFERLKDYKLIDD